MLDILKEAQRIMRGFISAERQAAQNSKYVFKALPLLVKAMEDNPSAIDGINYRILIEDFPETRKKREVKCIIRYKGEDRFYIEAYDDNSEPSILLEHSKAESLLKDFLFGPFINQDLRASRIFVQEISKRTGRNLEDQICKLEA